MKKNKNTFEGPIGAFLIKNGELSFEQAEQIMQIQQVNPEKRFGEIAVELGFIGYKEVNEYLEMLNQPLFPGEC